MRLFVCVLLFLSFSSCKHEYQETTVDLSSYEIEDGFHIQALAAEPLIEAPIAISFDDSGRIWVLEMTGYMQSLEGINEDAPIGRIVVLQDKDNDGIMDHTKVFLDNLKLTRALLHINGGLLHAEPPFLYFTEIQKNLTPGKTIVVDNEYAVGGNVEHQPNGLLLNIDNWIYSAKASKRYRLKNEEWLTEDTSFRGQWGITSDNMGRLLYNDNSNQIRGDWAIPNILNKNPLYKSSSAIGNNLVSDQNVYPLTATAVNRGYLPDMLHADGKLKRFTSACGPLYLEGKSFPNDYQGNVMVCAPEANLIKRNILDFKNLKITGEQAWKDKEFIRSSDETFRPVNLYNGPDGALYIVDMHRGIIQHKTYMTSYLRNKYMEKGLDTVIGMGRILKVSTQGNNKHKNIDLTLLNGSQLVDSLASKNIWIRNRAQQLIISGKHTALKKQLVEVIEKDLIEISKIHALYALEGLQKLSFPDIELSNIINQPKFMSHVIKLYADRGKKIKDTHIENLLNAKNEMIDYYLAYYFSKRLNANNEAYLATLMERYKNEDWFLEPILSGIHQTTFNLRNSSNKGFNKIVAKIDSLEQQAKTEKKQINESDGLTKGRLLYMKYCATCHGPDGGGNKDLAPPLLNSEYVSEEEEKLAAVMLYGLKGPISVNGKKFNFSNSMPGVGMNKNISDENIKDIGNYIRNAFTTSSQSLTSKLVDSLRNLPRHLDKMYTENELQQTYSHH
ncbi:hypothetical protein MTsPCn9_33610 [Croceitalea sp. MTPC9]|uniref:DUF7133 domain-containing protein n=1 Tax=unclassified Croceitalea TaxID=2632280 RepID=UPI002B3E9833|nr:hypothetical protein MTsPCn6_18420 [Croceitalea sp. MTPC6]GMN18421.1 hypothetical protein MTsPCn9_33610 [Croceitalea sp. MTPC9]